MAKPCNLKHIDNDARTLDGLGPSDMISSVKTLSLLYILPYTRVIIASVTGGSRIRTLVTLIVRVERGPPTSRCS